MNYELPGLATNEVYGLDKLVTWKHNTVNALHFTVSMLHNNLNFPGKFVGSAFTCLFILTINSIVRKLFFMPLQHSSYNQNENI